MEVQRMRCCWGCCSLWDGVLAVAIADTVLSSALSPIHIAAAYLLSRGGVARGIAIGGTLACLAACIFLLIGHSKTKPHLFLPYLGAKVRVLRMSCSQL